MVGTAEENHRADFRLLPHFSNRRTPASLHGVGLAADLALLSHHRSRCPRHRNHLPCVETPQRQHGTMVERERSGQ